MIRDSILENLSIHNDNLSVYYLGSIFITILTVVLTWWYHTYYINKIESFEPNPSDKEEELEDRLSGPVLKDSDQSESFIGENVKSQIKTARHSLAEEVAANLTEEQLMEEKDFEVVHGERRDASESHS